MIFILKYLEYVFQLYLLLPKMIFKFNPAEKHICYN